MFRPMGRFANLSRIVLQSHLRASAYRKESGYTATGGALHWASSYLKYLLGLKHPFVEYSGGDKDYGIYRMPDQTTIALAGDWGTGTSEAAQVAQGIKSFGPDYTIHLGDIYYVGDEGEVDSNFLGIEGGRRYEAVRWPSGRLGTYSLLGNHDMYSNGNGYFDVLLPTLGQKASFFCLMNKYWAVVGLDTGYHSTGLFASGRLPDPLMCWLRGLFMADPKQGIILLSHHQPWTAFPEEKAYPSAAKQLSKLIGRPVLWFWGHEHRMAFYDKFSVKGSIEAYGRCIGHGGMPVDITVPPDSKKAPWELFDARPCPNDEGLPIGYNGYATLEFSGSGVAVTYLDLKGKVLVTESWYAGSDGYLFGNKTWVSPLLTPSPK